MNSDRGAVPVGDGDQVVDGGVGRDLQGLGQAAAPVDVGLEDIEGTSVDEALEAPAGVFVFGAGQRNADFVLDLAVAVDAVRHTAILEPPRAIFGDAGGEVDDVGGLHRLPAVEHD